MAIDPNIELHIEKTRKEDREEYITKFSDIWVEKAFVKIAWVFGIGIAGALATTFLNIFK